ncbi:hypothetical protein SUGI_1175930 [Cryptomeria japonica]|nr:hypothetical protein SUGI_1175930 [Cryptomeria japonica]
MEPSKVPHIYIGDDTQVEVEGKGLVSMDDGTFENVLYVPNLTTNLPSIYQNTYYDNGKKFEFTPDSIVVKELDNDALVVVGQANHNSRFYSFSHFVPRSPSMALLTRSNSKKTHEVFIERSVHFEESSPILVSHPPPPSSIVDSDESDSDDETPSTPNHRVIPL